MLGVTHWKTKDGRIIAIEDMHMSHLLNVFCMCRLAILNSEGDSNMMPEGIVKEVEKRNLKEKVEEYWKVYRVMRS